MGWLSNLGFSPQRNILTLFHLKDLQEFFELYSLLKMFWCQIPGHDFCDCFWVIVGPMYKTLSVSFLGTVLMEIVLYYEF